MKQYSVRQWLTPLAVLFLFFCISRLFISHSLGSTFLMPPDSTEYTLGADSLLKHGNFGILLDQKFYPSRYLPWFSLTVLCPVISLFGGDVLTGIYGIFLFAAAGLFLMYFLGKKSGGPVLGTAATAILYLSPQYRFFSRTVMTEVPYFVLLLGMMLLFCRIVRNRKTDGNFFLYSLLTAWAGGIRATAFPMAVLPLVPLFLQEKRKGKRILMFAESVLPSCAVWAAGLFWNKHVFGSFLRNGYQYWCSVPYDYPELTFSLSYIPENLKRIFSFSYGWIACVEIVIVLIILWLTYRKKRLFDSPEQKLDFLSQSSFAMFQSVLLLVLYLPYFCSIPDRFFMPIPLLLIVPALTAVHAIGKSRSIEILCTGVLAAGTFFVSDPGILKPVRQTEFADVFLTSADRILPENAVLVTMQDCAVASYRFCTSSPHRHIVPVFRKQEYANKIIAPVYPGTLYPSPGGPLDHRTEALLKNPHCIHPFPFAFLEDAQTTSAYLRNHKVFIGKTEYELLQDILHSFLPDLRVIPVQEKDPFLYRLIL